jgi:hypothetical protein
LAKVAILPLNFIRSTELQIYEKLSYEALSRHFCQTRVTSCPSSFVTVLSCRVKHCLGVGLVALLHFFVWLLRWKNANVLPIALAIYFQVLLIVFDL